MSVARSDMKASPGDRLVVTGHRQGEAPRDCKVIAVLGEDGAPPYDVRWEEDGHVSRLYPGSDVHVHHFEHPDKQ